MYIDRGKQISRYLDCLTTLQPPLRYDIFQLEQSESGAEDGSAEDVPEEKTDRYNGKHTTTIIYCVCIYS
jgi:hypothetical protein